MSRREPAARPDGSGPAVAAHAAEAESAGERAMSSAGPSFAELLAGPGPLAAVELRPPRSGLDAMRGMDVWIDLHQAMRKLGVRRTPVLLTDGAVGDPEEDALAHLGANLGGDSGFGTVAPFLTCKHSLEYCRLFARRAAALGVGGLTVVGGDKSAGPPRCVPHGKDLRRVVRADEPGLALGGWANPHGDPVAQARFAAADDFCADYVLTQVVSHHSLHRAEALKAELDRTGWTGPVVFGVFYYRSADPRTLARLQDFFPVPARRLAAEFEAGVPPEEVCARSIRGLREIGAAKVYVSNLGARRPAAFLDRLAAAL